MAQRFIVFDNRTKEIVSVADLAEVAIFKRDEWKESHPIVPWDKAYTLLDIDPDIEIRVYAVEDV